MTATAAGPGMGPEGLVYSRADMTWLTPEEFQRRREDRERRAERRLRGNHFPCPQRHISDLTPFQIGLPGEKVTIGSRNDEREYCAITGNVPFEDNTAAARKTWAAEKAELDSRIEEFMGIREQMDDLEIEPLRRDVPDEAGFIDMQDIPIAVDHGTIVEPGA